MNFDKLEELRERLGMAIAVEGYTNAEEAFADGISRQYCLEYAEAMLRALTPDDLALLLVHRVGPWGALTLMHMFFAEAYPCA